LTFIGYKQTDRQTNKQTDKPNLYIEVEVDDIQTNIFLYDFLYQ